jgi:hypothetical protein
MHERRRILARAVVAAAVLALAAAAGCQAQQPDPPAAEAWIGATWPPPPGRVTIERAATLGTEDTASFAVAEVTAAGAHLLWLGHREGGSAAGATWTVTDVLPLPVLGPDRRLKLAVCGAPSGPDSVAIDPELVAYATPADSPVLKVRGAYRADRTTGRFQVIPYGGIVCRNDARAD